MTTQAIMARCRRIRESHRPLAALAEAYGIALRPPEAMTAHSDAGGTVVMGLDYGIDPFGRILFAETGDSDSLAFHEMIHIILALPFAGKNGVDDIYEELLLMQVERTIAQRCLPDRLLDLVYDSQNGTDVILSGRQINELGWYENLGQYPKWRDGWKIAKAIGVIDDERWPTFRWPDWPAMGEAGWRRLTER